MRTHLLTTAAIVLLSASCGSDSGPALESNTAADVAPPTVTALVPAPGDTNVWVHAPITVRFSAPVRTPADRTVVLALSGGGSIDTTVVRSADGRTLTIVPDSLPPSSSLVTVNFRAPVTDPAGRAAVIPAWWWIVPQWQHVAPSLQLGFGYNSVEVAAARDGSVYVAEQFSESPWSPANYVGVHKAEAGTWTSLGGPPEMRPSSTPTTTSEAGRWR